MIDSGLALSFAFTAITNLASVHDLRPQAFPSTGSDLQQSRVEPGFEIFQAVLDDKMGSSFWIRDGVVYRFISFDSFLRRADDKDLSKFRGDVKFGTNEIVQIATRTVTKLARDQNPIRGLTPEIGRESGLHDERMPYYWVSWPPSTNNAKQARYSALVEVDARSGCVTYFDLKDQGFYSRELMLAISNRVYKPQPFVQRTPRPSNLPEPQADQVMQAIASWARLCQMVGIHVGDETNLSDVDWTNSYAYTNTSSTGEPLECFVVFNDGAAFRAGGTLAFAASAPDACFVGPWQQQPREYFDRFKARVDRNWKELAKLLEENLVRKAGLPRELFEEFRPTWRKRPPQVGVEAFSRIVVDWRWWPKGKEFVSIEESKLGMCAEFDLATGQLKSINLAPEQTKFLDALRAARPVTKAP